MQKLSIVIACKNEADVIFQTISSFDGLTDDIIIYDNGSTDETKNIVRKTNAKLFEGTWEGYGKTKNKANEYAKYDWILSLDADEAIDQDLKQALLQLDFSDDSVAFQLRFKNFIGTKWLRFGEWGNDKHIRLFNRSKVKWNDADVHESLMLPANTKIMKLNGAVLHKTASSIKEFENKMNRYTMLNAEKYFRQKKKSILVQLILSPVFSFIKNYFFKLGFLDGIYGFHCARINASYTYLKYKELKRLNSISSGA